MAAKTAMKGMAMKKTKGKAAVAAKEKAAMKKTKGKAAVAAKEKKKKKVHPHDWIGIDCGRQGGVWRLLSIRSSRDKVSGLLHVYENWQKIAEPKHPR